MSMARRKSSRRRGFNLQKVRVADSLAIGALPSLDLISFQLIGTVTSPARITSIECSFALGDIGATQDDGQEFGIAHNDYTSAEIEECLEALNSSDFGNKVAQEQANRLVRTIGYFQGAPGTGAGKSFNNGMPVKVKLNWYLGTGDGIVIWCRNGSDTIYTDGANLTTVGHLWLRPA